MYLLYLNRFINYTEIFFEKNPLSCNNGDLHLCMYNFFHSKSFCPSTSSIQPEMILTHMTSTEDQAVMVLVVVVGMPGEVTH